MKKLMHLLAVPMALLAIVFSFSACIGLEADFGNGSAGGIGLGCNTESCVFVNGNYLTVTISHTDSADLVTGESLCLAHDPGDSLCLINAAAGSLNGPFGNIEYNAVLDSNCLYGIPLYGYCGSPYGTYGVSLLYSTIAYTFGNYGNVGGCLGFRINLWLGPEYQRQSWFVTDPAGQGSPPGGAFCPF